MENKERYKEHYSVYIQIATKVNELTELIQEFGELPQTGNENIDNLHHALAMAHDRTIDIFISDTEEDEC